MLERLHKVESTLSANFEEYESSSEQEIQEILEKVQKEVDLKGLHFWDNSNEDTSPTVKKLKKNLNAQNAATEVMKEIKMTYEDKIKMMNKAFKILQREGIIILKAKLNDTVKQTNKHIVGIL